MIASAALKAAENTVMAAKEQFKKLNEKKEFSCPFVSV